MHPFLFTIGGFRFPAYGFMVACGYLAAILYLLKRRVNAPLTADQGADLMFYAAAAGILGAKAAFALTYWKELGADAASRAVFIFKNFPYGFVFYGGLVAGAAVSVYYCRRQKLDFLRVADHFAPALALAHGFGRLGCFLAGCCHGRPAGGFPGVAFSDRLCEVAPAYLGIPLHPVQLYEAAGNFLIFGGLHILNRKSFPRGAVFSAYLASYSALRFAVEFLRGDDRGGSWLGLSPAQVLSAVFGAISLAIFIRARDHGKHKI